MNTEVRKKAKNYFQEDFFKLMKYAVFGKTKGNVRKHRDIKLVTTEKRRNYLVPKPNYPTTNFLAIEMRKIHILMNKLVYLGLSMLELSKIVMYEFCYDYVKPRYGETMFDSSNYELNKVIIKREK